MKHSRIALTFTLALLVVSASMTPRAAAPAADQSGRPIALANILAWKAIASPTVSNDGRWLAYRLSPREGDGEVIVRSTQTDKEVRFPAGEVPLPPDPDPGAAGPPPPPGLVAFSPDGKRLAFTVYPTAKDAKQLRRQNRQAQNKAALVNLESFEKIEVDRVKRLAFAGERGGWIAFHRYGAADAPLLKPLGRRRHRAHTVRMKEFFDHHLMDKPAPDWLTAGVPRLSMEEHLK